MKIKNIIFIILGALAVGAVAIFCIVKFFDHSMKPEDFKKHLAALGYEVTESASSEKNVDNYMIASKSDVDYKVEYYNFKDTISAQKFYKSLKKNLVNYITSSTKDSETTGNIFAKQVSESEDDYIVISRIKNTIVFVDGTSTYKEDIKTLIKNINY